MSTATEPLMTAEAFLAKFGDCSGVELVRGKVVRAGQGRGQLTETPAVPNFEHGVIASRVCYLLTQHVLSHDLGWVASNDTFVSLGGDPASVLGPDVLFVSFSRVPRGKPPKHLTVAPELVFEIRSPTDRWGDIFGKVGEYLNGGVTVVVILDPHTESASVHRQDELQRIFHNGDELTLPDVLPGFAVPVARLFGV